MAKITPYISLFSSIIAVITAYIMQCGFDVIPCKICIYQRVIYYISIAIATSMLIIPRYYKQLFVLLVISYLSNILIAFYQVAVEQRWVENVIECVSGISGANLSDEEILDMTINSSSVPCDIPQLVIFGISIAGWNVLYCFFSLLIILYCRKKYEISFK